MAHQVGALYGLAFPLWAVASGAVHQVVAVSLVESNQLEVLVDRVAVLVAASCLNSGANFIRVVRPAVHLVASVLVDRPAVA